MALFQNTQQEDNLDKYNFNSDIGAFYKDELKSIYQQREQEYAQAKERQNAWISNIVSPDKINEWNNQGKMSALDTWSKFKKYEILPYVGTVSQGVESFKLKGILDKIRRGEVISAQEKKQMEEFVLDMAEMQTRGMTFGAKAVDFITNTAPFAIEFGLGLATTGGVASLGAVSSKVAQKGAIKAVKEGVKESVDKAIEQGIGKTIAKGVGKVAYDATINPRTWAFSATRLPQQIYARMGEIELNDSMYVTPQGQLILNEAEANPATAFLKALALTNIETASEMSGLTLFDPVKRKLSGVIAPKILERLPKKFSSKLVETVEKTTNLPFFKAVEQLGFNGVIEEMGEERVGDILRFAFDLDDTEGWSFEQLLDAVFVSPEQMALEAVSFGAFGVGANLANAGLSKVSERYSKDEFLIDAGVFRTGGALDKIDKKVKSLLEQSGKTEEEINTVLQHADRETKIQYLKDKNIKTIEVDDENVLEKIQEQVADVYRASNKNVDEDTIQKISKVIGTMAKSIAEKENLTIDDIKDRLPSLEQVNGYMYADESGKGYTQEEINNVLDLAQNDLMNLPVDFADENYVNDLQEDIRILQDMANGKLDEKDSARAWDILNRNVQRKEIGLLQQKDDVSIAGADESDVEDARREWEEKGTDTHFLAFSNTQIKSVDNRGTFDIESPNIYYQTGIKEIDESKLYNRLPQNLKEAIDFIFNGKPVYKVTGEEFPNNGENFIDRVTEYYQKKYNSKINIDNFGEVLLDKKSVKNSSHHYYNTNKINAFAAVPYVLQNGKIANYQEKYKGKTEDRYLFVAPITINNEDYFCEVIVKATDKYANSGVKRFYLHEVELKKKLVDVFQTSFGGTSTSSKSIIADLINKYNPDVKKHEENNLVMAHASKLSNLDEVIETGSLIAPSFSITTKESETLEEGKFGEVLFIRNPKKIDYQNDNIYDRDIYSPRMPQPHYDIPGGRTVDSYEYNNLKRDYERDPEKFVNKWGETFDEYFKGAKKVLFLGYTPSGNRKYVPYNTENILKEMTKKGLLNKEGFDYGLSSLLARFSSKQTSKSNLKETAKTGLSKSKDVDKQWEEIKDEYDKLGDKLAEYYYDKWSFYEVQSDAFYALAKNMKKTINDIFSREVPKELQQEVKEFVEKAKSLPRSYFEAKPMREVELSEFSNVLVRKGELTQEQKQGLEDWGVKVTEYEKGKLYETLETLDKNEIYFQDNQQRGSEPEQQNIFPGNRTAKKIHKVKGGYLPVEKFIELFKNADASTIVHECAHWYLDELTRIAKYNEEVAEDLEAVRKFLKNEGEEFTRAQHEKFARSFEAYILTGSSRNNKLKKVFEDFKNWLIQIYDEIKSLGINMKEMPEITNLFDRLLTSEKQRSAGVFNKINSINEKISEIIAKQEEELDELDEIYATNIQENNRKSDIKRKVDEYLELASKATKREPKEVREFRERYKEATLQILEIATGYDRRFISQARNASKVEEAINNVEDKITISGGLRAEWQEFYADTGINYDTDEVGGDYELATQAWQVFQDGTYKIDNGEYSDIEEFAGKFDYLYGKVLSLQGEERYVALEALYSLFNDIPAVPDEYLQDVLEKLQGIEETISQQEREAFNRKNFVNIPVVEHLQWFITDKIKNLKIYNPETKYRMRLDKSHRLYKYIKGATSINNAKNIVRKINEFVIEDLRNQQRAILHKEIQKQVRINSKVVRTGSSSKGKFDWKTNSVFIELQTLNKLSKAEALEKYEQIAKMSEYENTQIRDGWDSKETKFDEFKNDFDFNLIRNFIEYKSQTGRLEENAKGQRVSTLNIQLGTKILEDIIKLKEIGREAKSEEELKKKLNKRSYRNNFIELIRKNGSKPWVRKFVTHLLYSGQSLANWETTLNAVFGSEVSQELSLLEDEARVESYKRKFANKLFNRIRKIYKMKDANAFEMALDYDNVQQIIDLFQGFEKEKYTILETSFDINTGEYFRSNVELTKGQLITLYGWYQNENYARRLETQYNPAQLLDLFENKLSDKEKDIVWAVIDTLQEMYPDVNEVFINETGLSLPQEQNYIPGVAERIVSDLDMLHDCISASKAPSATKRRKTNNRIKMAPASLMEIVLPHIDKMSRYVILQEKLNFYRAIFTNANITAVFREVYGKKDGEALHREIKNQLEEFSFGSTNKRMGKLKEFADGVAKNFIVGSIGGSFKVALGQLTSVINYSENMPVVEWSAGFAKSLANPVQTFNYMMNNSPYLQARLAGNAQNEIIATLTNEADKFRKITNLFTLNVKWGDIIAITLGGKPYVDYLVSQGMSLEEAMREFEAETMRAQQASSASSTSRWQKKQTETALGRMFWAFRTVEFQFERKVYDAILKGARGEITPTQAIKTIMIYRVVNPVIFSVLLQQVAIAPLLRMLFGDDDDPAETWKGLGISGALAVLCANLSHWGYFGIVGSFVIQSLIKKFSGDKNRKAFKTQVPFVSDIEDITAKLLKENGPDTSDYVEAMAVGIKYGFGVPADKIINFGEGVSNVAQGDVGIGLLRMGGWGEYPATEAITGKPPKKEKKKRNK